MSTSFREAAPALWLLWAAATALAGAVACGSEPTGEPHMAAGAGPVSGGNGSGGGSGGGAQSAGQSGLAGMAGSAAAGAGGVDAGGGNGEGAGALGGSSGTAGASGAGSAASGQGGSAAGAGGVGGSGGTAAGNGGTGGASGASGGSVDAYPPVSDTKSSIPIASPGSGYKVDANIPYGPLAQQRLDVIYPTGGKAGPNGTEVLPGVIMFHGGGWIQGDKATMASFYSRFLAHGFIVCTAEYRVASGMPNGAIAPAAVQDALLAAKWFWDHMDYYRVDKARYVVTGGSAGGHLALMVGMATPAAQLGPTSPEDFKIAAIVNGYGPSDVADLLARGTSFAVQWLPANTPDRAALARRLSPTTYVRREMPPLISVHGSNDSTVPTAQSRNLDTLLKTAGADATLSIIDGAGHGFGSPANAWADAERAMFGFLVAHGIGR